MANLSIGIDSYVTLEEANEFVTDNFVSDSPEYEAWFSPTRPDNDKMVSLRASCKALNNLRFKGQKMVVGQPLAFPRKFNSFPGMVYLPYRSQFMDSTLLQGNGGSTGLSSAKEAQIVNSVYHLMTNKAVLLDANSRSISGILAKRAGSISESYDSTSTKTADALKGIYNQDKVYYILNSWLSDAVFSL